MTDQPHQGRFVISSPEFLDPAVYEKDTQITVAGMLAGEIDRTVDKKVLHLPLLSLTTLHLWPDYTNNPMYGSYGTYNAYYGYPGWGGAFYRPIFFPPPR
jgi:outer membrane lipoprotein